MSKIVFSFLKKIQVYQNHEEYNLRSFDIYFFKASNLYYSINWSAFK